MNPLNSIRSHFSIIFELLSMFWHNRYRWLIPMLIILFVLGLLIVLGQSSAVAPFIYTLF